MFNNVCGCAYFTFVGDHRVDSLEKTMSPDDSPICICVFLYVCFVILFSLFYAPAWSWMQSAYPEPKSIHYKLVDLTIRINIRVLSEVLIHVPPR